MNIQTAFGKSLTTAAHTVAIVGQRSYWTQSPQEPTFPLVVYQVTGQQPKAREIVGPNRWYDTSITVWCYSRTSMDDATALADALITDFDQLQGTLGGLVQLGSFYFVNRWDDPQQDKQLFGSCVQFQIEHK